jgi:hypothetical protein
MLKLVVYVLVFGGLFFATSKKFGSISGKPLLISLSIAVTLLTLLIDLVISQYIGGPQAKPSIIAVLIVGFGFYNIMKPNVANLAAPASLNRSSNDTGNVAKDTHDVMRAHDIAKDGSKFVVYGADGSTAYNYDTLDEAVAASKRMKIHVAK